MKRYMSVPCFLVFLLHFTAILFFPGVSEGGFPEEQRFFPVSQQGVHNEADLVVMSIEKGRVVWCEKDPQNGSMSLKFFNGKDVVTLDTYSSDDWDMVSRSWPVAIAFDDCVIYREPDFKGDWYRWLVHDPKKWAPDEPLVSDSLNIVADGNQAVWVRHLYAKETDTQAESTQLRMHTCGSGTTTTLSDTIHGDSFQLNEGQVAWTETREPATGIWSTGEVTTEIWVHDSAGSRKVWECNYPEFCDFEPPGNDAIQRFLRDWQHPNTQAGLNGGVLAMRLENRESGKYGVLIHKIGSGASSSYYAGSGRYATILARDGYVLWTHYDEFGAVANILIYDVSTGDIRSLPYDDRLLRDNYVMDAGTVLYNDGASIYLYDIAKDSRALIDSGRDLSGSGLYFRRGRVVVSETVGNDLVINYFQRLEPATEIGRFPKGELASGLWLDDKGHAWWGIKHSATIIKCEDPALGTGFDRDLFTWNPVAGKTIQITPTNEINDVFLNSPHRSGTLAWVGLRHTPRCGDGLGPEGKYQLYLGGSVFPYISGNIKFKDGNGKSLTLPDLKLDFKWGMQNSNTTDSISLYTDANGHFRVIPPFTKQAEASGSFTITLKDKQGWVEVQHPDPNNNNQPVTVSFETAPFGFRQSATVKLTINLTNTSAFRNPNIGTANQARLDDLAQIYFYTHQAAEFASDKLKLTLDDALPAEIRAFSSVSGVYHTTRSPEFINLEAKGSILKDPDWPNNREWHEFGHHIMADSSLGGDNKMPAPRLTPTVKVDMDDNRNNVFNEASIAGWSIPSGQASYIKEVPYTFNSGIDVNHVGYANSTTTDSLIEGFAEFMSLLIADNMTTETHPEVYKWAGGNTNLEALHQAWNWSEEFAVASLLWDLYDDHVDSYSLWGLTLDDRIDLTLDQLWKRINAPNIQDMKDVYDALSDLNIDNDNDGIGDIDEIFIAHGFFADTNPSNKQYDKGEEVGRAAYDRQVTGYVNVLVDNTLLFDNGNGVYDPYQATANPSGDRNLTYERIRVPGQTNRRKLPLLDNSFIEMSFIDSDNGEPVSDITLEVNLNYDDPYSEYDDTYTVSMAGNGNMPIYMPQLPASATIVARADGYEDSDPFILSTDQYWQALETGAENIASHTFTLKPVPSYFLGLTIEGEGFGSVTSQPAGIDCGNDCSSKFPAGSEVTLVASAEAGSRFAGWGGYCSSCGTQPSCPLQPSADLDCTARFDIARNQPPVIESFEADVLTGEAPLTVSFNCKGNDPDGTVAEFRWDVDGNGTTDEISQDGYLRHTYIAAGTYAAACLLVDDQGSATTSNELTITVSDTTGGVAAGIGNDGKPDTSDKRCFIATAAYGSYLEPHVKVLRAFRDNYLLSNTPGRWFVKKYYAYSPPLARLIASHESLRIVTRAALTPLVWIIEYPLAAVLLVSGLVVLIVVRKNKDRIRTA